MAGDSTKLRAQNSKKNNFNAEKIERHVAYSDDILNEYSAVLAEADNDLSDEKRKKSTIVTNKNVSKAIGAHVIVRLLVFQFYKLVDSNLSL